MSLCGYQIPEEILYYLLCADFKVPKTIPEWQRKTILNANENGYFLEKYLLCRQIPKMYDLYWKDTRD